MQRIACEKNQNRLLSNINTGVYLAIMIIFSSSASARQIKQNIKYKIKEKVQLKLTTDRPTFV